MQYTNASIFMGKLFYDFVFVPTEGVVCPFRRMQYRRRRGVCLCSLMLIVLLSVVC